MWAEIVKYICLTIIAVTAMFLLAAVIVGGRNDGKK